MVHVPGTAPGLRAHKTLVQTYTLYVGQSKIKIMKNKINNTFSPLLNNYSWLILISLYN